MTVSSVNVTDYTKYSTVDPAAIKALLATAPNLDITSVETTHGVVKCCTDCPMIFISGIANRTGFYNQEATAAQRYVASFNMGVVLGTLIMEINEFLQQGFNF